MDYPEELVEKVARAIRETNPALTRGHLSEAEGVHSDATAYAVAALDALGVQIEWGLRDGDRDIPAVDEEVARWWVGQEGRILIKRIAAGPWEVVE